MNHLEEVAARARRDGSVTEQWGKVRNLYFRDELKSPFGVMDMQKLRDWAESQDLLMDFDYTFEDFSSGIRTVTLLPKHQSLPG